MNDIKKINICIAGLGNVGSQVLVSLINNNDLIKSKSNLELNILGISAKNKSKKRNFNLDKFKWFDNPMDLINVPNCHILIELIGEEKGISYELVKSSLEKKINVITANKALLSKHGKNLFKIAENNKVLLLFEAAVAGGIPIIRLLKKSIFLNKVHKITGILNGTTNYILTEMESKDLNFDEILEDAQSNGYVEANPTNDLEGIDSAHKLSLLSTICFGSEIDLENISYKGIMNIDLEDIKYANNLGYKIKLISESQIIDGKIMSFVEPTLLSKKNYLSNVNGVLNAIKIESDHLNPLLIEGEGAGGKATASSIISDIYEIAMNDNQLSLGFHTNQLIKYETVDLSNKLSSYYLRIIAKDISGVLATITSILNREGISIETILQTPDKKTSDNTIPIIIVTHETTRTLLMKSIIKIEKLDFVIKKIAILTIDKNID